MHAERATPITLKGFGRIGFKTAYLDVYKSFDATALVRRILKALNANLPILPVLPHEGKKLHASIARFMDRKRSRRVMRHVKEESPKFTMLLDNIAILKKTDRTWKVVTVIPLKKETQEVPVFDVAPEEVLLR